LERNTFESNVTANCILGLGERNFCDTGLEREGERESKERERERGSKEREGEGKGYCTCPALFSSFCIDLTLKVFRFCIKKM